MPRISMFFGIVVAMYFDDHAPPHFHVLYEGEEAVCDLQGNVIIGRLSVRAGKLLREWAKQHQKELSDNWRRAKAVQPLEWIPPLQ